MDSEGPGGPTDLSSAPQPSPSVPDADEAAAAAEKKKKKKKAKVRSAWISFAGRIVAQIVGAAATIVLGIYLVTNHKANSSGAPARVSPWRAHARRRTIARRPAVRQLLGRRVAGLLRQRHDRGPHRGPGASARPARHLAHLVDALSGSEEGVAGDRQRARRRSARRGVRRARRQPRAHHRAVDRRGERRAHLGAFVRGEGRGSVRAPVAHRHGDRRRNPRRGVVERRGHAARRRSRGLRSLPARTECLEYAHARKDSSRRGPTSSRRSKRTRHSRWRTPALPIPTRSPGC